MERLFKIVQAHINEVTQDRRMNINRFLKVMCIQPHFAIGKLLMWVDGSVNNCKIGIRGDEVENY